MIHYGGRIYGDGVNSRALVEGLAEVKGICNSGRGYDQVKNKLALGYEYLDEQTVKNIPEPIRAFRVSMEPGAKTPVASRLESRLEAPRRPDGGISTPLQQAAGNALPGSVQIFVMEILRS